MKTEMEMRDEEVPYFKDINELIDYINALTDRKHDYGTIAYAMSMAATATFNYVGSKLDATGFLSSCADLDIIRRTRLLNCPFMLIKGDDLLYPQYDIIRSVKNTLDYWITTWGSKKAKELLAQHFPEKSLDEIRKYIAMHQTIDEHSFVHPDVIGRWLELSECSEETNENSI